MKSFPVRRVIDFIPHTKRELLSCGHAIPACYPHGLLKRAKTRRCYTCYRIQVKAERCQR